MPNFCSPFGLDKIHTVLTTHGLAYLCCQCFASLDLKLAPKWKQQGVSGEGINWITELTSLTPQWDPQRYDWYQTPSCHIPRQPSIYSQLEMIFISFTQKVGNVQKYSGLN